MGAILTDDPVLVRFRAALAVLYGDRLERAVLYGSRARTPTTILPCSCET